MLFGFATLGLHFDGSSMDRAGLGGSETAMICLSREFAKRGHDVHVFCLTDRPGIYYGVTYHTIEDLIAFNDTTGFDVFVVSRFPELLSSKINAKLKLLWCHDMLADRDRLMTSLWQVDKVILLSQFQINSYLEQVPELAPLIWKSSNGVDMDLVNANLRPKVPGKLIYTSRPERGLLYLLRDIFPKLLAERPDLKLHVCWYETPGLKADEAVKSIHGECDRLIRSFGDSVVKLGSLTKAQLYQEISSAQVWLYPTAFPEISCISAMEAQACGTKVITTRGFALKETVCDTELLPAGRPNDEYRASSLICGLPTDDAYVSAFVKSAAILSDHPHLHKRTLRHKPQAEYSLVELEAELLHLEHYGFTWTAVAAKWDAMIQEELSEKGHGLYTSDVSRLNSTDSQSLLIGFGNCGVPFEGDAIERAGLGGSETAIICLARELAKQGHHVHVFNTCERPGVYHGVSFHRLEPELPSFNKTHHFDVFVCAQSERIMERLSINARLKIYWAQGQFWQVGEHHVSSLMWQCDKIATISEFQRQSFRKAMPGLSDLLWDAPNGVDMSLVEANRRPKESGKLIYLSRPERGLLHLLRDIFPKLLEKRPDLKLYVCTYTIPGMELPEKVQAIYAECERRMNAFGDSVVRLGSLTKAQLYQHISSSQAVVYPCDFEEAGCIAAIESQACGTAIITTNDYALKETASSSLATLISGPINSQYVDSFVHAIDMVLRHPYVIDEREWIAEKGWDWKNIASRWSGMFRDELHGKSDPIARFTIPSKPTVAACIIAKNEENDIRRCLQRVAPFVDCVKIILDDSTADDTWGVIERYSRETTTPITVTRCAFDNFGQMRNESIKGVTTDWILWIDADEELIGGEFLRQYLDTRFFNGYVIRQRHLMLDAPESIDTPIRLFRNKPQYKFVGMVHEHAEDTAKGDYDNQIAPAMILPDVQIAHRGYTNEHLRREKVSNRNMKLLRRSLREEPSRQMTWVMAARDCLTVPRWQALEHGKIERGSIHHKMLCASIEIYLSKFSDETCQFHGMALPIYEDVCRLMSQFGLPAHGRKTPPFEVAIGLLGTVHPGGLQDRKQLEGRGYWFVDEEQFRKMADAKREKLLAALGLHLVVCPETTIETTTLNNTVQSLLSTADSVVDHKYSKENTPHVAA